MSAVPVAVLAFGGTSDFASSVALNVSALAAPANSTAAPNANAANMALVMALSLLLSPRFHNNGLCGFIPEKAAIPPQIVAQFDDWSNGGTGPKVATGHDGTLDAAPDLACRPHRRRGGVRPVLVADVRAAGRRRNRPRIHARHRQRRSDLQRRRLRVLPCRSQPARPFEARRRTGYSLALWYLLRTQHLARQG